MPTKQEELAERLKNILDKEKEVAQVEKDKPQPTEKKVELPDPEKKVETTTPEKVVEPSKPEFDKKKFLSGIFDQEFEDENIAKEHYRSLTEKANKLPTLEQELETFRKKTEELEAGVDPLQFFANENEYKRQQLLKEFPSYNAELLTTITVGDLTKLSPVEILAVQRQLKDPDIYTSKEKATESIYDEFTAIDRKTGETIVYDEEKPFNEQDERIQVKILKASKDAKAEFETIKSKIKPWEKVDPSKKKADQDKIVNDLKEKHGPGWKAAFRNLPEQVKSFKFEIPYKDGKEEKVSIIDFEIEPGFIEKVKKELPDVIDLISIKGVELNKENEKKIIEGAIGKIFSDYFGKKENITKLLAKQRSVLFEEWTQSKIREDAGLPDMKGQERPNDQRKIDADKVRLSQQKEFLEKKKKGLI